MIIPMANKTKLKNLRTIRVSKVSGLRSRSKAHPLKPITNPDRA